ncbi:MAG: TIGR03000 domain-containing protein [Planctomycetia bacterium]|nr:TIGR03000 domain-containing protein [Planctomycetia bacterium]
MTKFRNAMGALLCAALLAPLWGGEDKKDEKKEAPKKEATLIIKVPEDATLWIDGEEYTDQKEKTERTFRSTPLEPGKRYFYTVKAKWMPNNYETYTRVRRAIVEAGKTSTLDLTKIDPKVPDDIFIRFVPTPQEVVDKMMEMGKVGKDDIVYDLGCGDGRLVVTAVSKRGAKKGVGVDLDPDRLKESNDNAKAAKVTDKVEFRKQDVMKVAKLEEATVVTMYLSDGLSDQLRPILLKRLKPGSRIVSHRFLMGSWKPEKTETVTVDGEAYKIHLWTVPGTPKKEEKPVEKKPVEKKDDKKPEKKDDKKPVEKKPVEKKDDKKPENKDDKKPVEKKPVEKKPVEKKPENKDVKKPFEKKDDKKPENKDDKKPVEKKGDKKPENKDDKKPVEKKDEKKPALMVRR